MKHKILIKFPTRERKTKFFSVLNKYIEMASDISNIGFLITLDRDDAEMTNEHTRAMFDKIKQTVKLEYLYGNSKTKIEAINADMEKVKGWDIVLLASDDMIPIVSGYDDIIRTDMLENFPDTDGTLWYKDGGQDNINTLCILGKKYFDRFNYIYHPAYKSLWCDNEFTEVSLKLNKCYKSNLTIIEHAHPVYQKSAADKLYVRNESFFSYDKVTFEQRQLKNFEL